VLCLHTGLLGLLLAAGCFTTANVATMAPLHTAYPVSASAQYVDQSGRIVTDREYEVVHSFSFHRAITAPPHVATMTALALEPDLDRIMSTTKGDAITGMTLQAVDYDVGSHYPAAGLKLAGWTFGIAGGAVIGLGAAVGEEEGTTLLKTGVVITGLGVLSYVIGSVLKNPATWHLEVSGNVVRRN
jgi:hypothetical protein